ncbi:MAG: sialidase family protein [Chloroflexota bacterium]
MTRVRFDRAARTLTRGSTVMAIRVSRSVQAVHGAPAVGTAATSIDPQWCHGLDVDRATGTVYLAVADYRATAAGKPRGVVRVGRSSDGGRTWTWRTLPTVTLPGSPAAGGGLGSSFKPTVAARDGVVFVGFHVITDVRRSAAAARRPVIGTYFAGSVDGGLTYAPPVPVARIRWRAAALERGVNGPGLRERADFTADGHVFYVYGDGRRAAPSPSRAWGRGAIYGALVFPGAAASP